MSDVLCATPLEYLRVRKKYSEHLLHDGWAHSFPYQSNMFTKNTRYLQLLLTVNKKSIHSEE